MIKIPRARTTLAAVLLALLPVPAAAAGDGLPVGGLDTTRTGIAPPDGLHHYYALPAGGRTQLIRVPRGNAVGAELGVVALRGTLAIPGVALDGTTSGISADGATLVAIEPRQSFPRRETRLVTIDTKRMAKTATIALEGDFSFDAISPDGSTIYLIHYLSRRDPTRYEVRAYDLARERLRGEPIIDRRAAPQLMRGFPITRAMSPDGVWAYTLYDGGGATPFVHALNTAEGTSVCIALAMLEGNRRLFDLKLAPTEDGRTIALIDRLERPRATIDTATWVPSEPQAPAAPEAADSAAADSDGAIPAWWGLPAFALGLGLIGLGFRRRRRARSAELPPDPFGAIPADGVLEREPDGGEHRTVR